MELGEKIAFFRKQARMTIDELSNLSGVPKGTLNKIINGITKDPQLETVRAIAYALGCTLDDFDDSPDPRRISCDEYSIIKKYRALDRHGKEIVDAVLKIEAGRMQDQEKPLLEFVARGGGTLPSGIADPSAIHTDQVRIRDEQTDADERI